MKMRYFLNIFYFILHYFKLKEAKRNLKTAIEENKEIQSNISKTKETLK